MKKVVVVSLIFSLLMGLCACAGNGEAGADGLQVGYGRESITPDFSVALGGYSDQETRKSSGFFDYIYATCIAMTEAEETVLLFTMDLLRTDTPYTEAARQAITEATGIPKDHILFGATHTHSGPSTSFTDSGTAAYRTLYMSAVVKAAQAALADRAPASVHATKTVVENMNFVRHYLLEDGTYAGANFGDFDASPIKEHAAEADDEMILVQFQREGEDKQDILLMNWQAHPCYTNEIGYNNISADFIGKVRSKVETDTGMHFAYFTGAAGNLVTSSKIEAEDPGLNLTAYGESLAQAAIDALSTMTPVEGSGVKSVQEDFTYDYDHSYDGMVSQAQQVYDLWKSTNITTGNLKAKEYGFSSVYQARAIIDRANKPLTGTMELNAVSVAGIGFVTAPFEMFAVNGMYIKERSPFDITLVCTSSTQGYIPSSDAFAYHSYEADTGFYAQGCAEATAEKLVEMLSDLQ